MPCVPILRPKRSSATCCGFWAPWHVRDCACAELPAFTPAPTNSTMATTIDATRRLAGLHMARKSAADALDRGAACRELVLEALEAAVEVIDAIHHGVAF